MNKQKNLINQGDIFALGDHRLACGSSGDPKLVAQLAKDQKVKATITDPPYGVDYVGSKKDFTQFNPKHKDIANDGLQSDEAYRKFTSDWLKAIRPHLESKNVAYIFNSDKMLFPLRDGMLDAGFYFSQILIWIKNQGIVGHLNYMPEHELLAYGWFGKHEFLKSKDRSVLYHPKPQKSKLHPTTKPVALIRRLILNSTRIGDTIYDGFGGSGTTLFAAEQTKRKCLMIELDPHYCQIIIDRFEKLTGIKAKLIS